MALGRELILKRKNASDIFDPVCIVEQRSLQINNEEVDTTKPSCTAPGGPLHFSAIPGIQSIRFSGNGAHVDNATAKLVTLDILNQAIHEYQVVVPSVGTFEGSLLLTSANFTGEKTNELQRDLTGVFVGAVEFEAAV